MADLDVAKATLQSLVDAEINQHAYVKDFDGCLCCMNFSDIKSEMIDFCKCYKIKSKRRLPKIKFIEICFSQCTGSNVDVEILIGNVDDDAPFNVIMRIYCGMPEKLTFHLPHCENTFVNIHGSEESLYYYCLKKYETMLDNEDYVSLCSYMNEYISRKYQEDHPPQ